MIEYLQEIFPGIYIDDVNVEVEDGCIVEHDGVCPHGFISPIRQAGLI